MSGHIDKLKEVSNNPQNIFLLVALLGGGGALWKPITNLINGITDRQNVTNVILCTKADGELDEDCLDTAWEHVINRKLVDEARHGDH